MSTEAVAWVIKASPCTGSTLLVHLMIADVVNDDFDNQFWMAADKLATKARVSRRKVYEALAELRDRGLLELVEHGKPGGKPSTYRFVIPGGAQISHKGAQKSRRGCAESATRTLMNSKELGGARKTKDGDLFLPGTGVIRR